LQRYGRDLTAAAQEGLLDPLLGRDDVVQRVLQILLRRTKNNPVLIGDPGVGKTAVAEGVAQLAASPAAPPALRGRSIVSVDVGSLIAGTQYRGAFEERLQGILSDVRNSYGRIILFIDEIHMLMDAGRVEGGMNAANLLKPALARGELRCMGATTVEEFRKYIEPDAAFSRRLQPVMVEEPSAEDAIIWLEGLRGRYEQYHGVVFAEDALSTAVSACQRFVPDRRLPDGAIDLLDEAASRVQLKQAAQRAAAGIEIGSHHPATHEIITGAHDDDTKDEQQGESPQTPQWREAEILGQRGGGMEDGTRKLLEWFGAVPENPLPGFAGHRQTAAARRQAYLRHFGHLKYPAGTMEKKEEEEERQADFPSSAMNTDPDSSRVRGFGGGGLPCPHCGTPTPSVEGATTVQCPRCAYRFLNVPPEKLMLGSSLFLELEKQQQRYGRRHQEEEEEEEKGSAVLEESAWPVARSAPRPLVSGIDVLEVVAGAAGIPIEQVLSAQSTWRSLEELENALLRRVRGQRSAVHAVASCIRLGLALGGHGRRRRPLASLLLTGPSGVGKGTLCRALADILFGSDHAMLRFDLAQCTDKTAVSRLIGAPPGFVGFGDGGALTEALRRRPHSVVVFEHAELAHRDVMSLLRQVGPSFVRSILRKVPYIIVLPNESVFLRASNLEGETDEQRTKSTRLPISLF